MGPQLRPVTLEDIVQTDVVSVEPDTPIPAVVAQLAEKDVGSVIVVEDDRPTGILTDRTICLALEDDPELSDRTAGDLAAEDIVTGTIDETIFEAVKTMRDEEVRRLPIVGEDGSLEGIVTLDDVLVLLGSELHNAVQVVREQSPRF